MTCTKKISKLIASTRKEKSKSPYIDLPTVLHRNANFSKADSGRRYQQDIIAAIRKNSRG